MLVKQSTLSTVALFLLFAAFANISAAGAGKKVPQVKDGVWGGSHVRMQVENGRATLQFDCAHAEITSPLVVDSSGRFKLTGRYTEESGGPVRIDRKIKYHNATFTGRQSGDTIDLTVVLTESGNKVGEYRLKYGEEPKLFRCY